MAKSRPTNRASKSRSSKPSTHSSQKPKPQTSPSPQTLLASASTHLIQSSPDLALPLAQRALSLLQPPSSEPTLAALPALNLLAQIHLDLGDADAAREYFLKGVELDPDGQEIAIEGGGAEKFLWLAQLCEEGGAESVEWFEKGCASLRHEISLLESNIRKQNNVEEVETEIQDRRHKLSTALCGIVEIWMTDLSFEDEAEGECERLITEAMLVTPEDAEVLQTLASVRISQERMGEAREALRRSMALWLETEKGEGEGDGDGEMPAFASRISLARLCMEVGMLEEAKGVLERLVAEDDESVEAWYLGGWCLFLMGEGNGQQKQELNQVKGGQEADEPLAMLRRSRTSLGKSLELYERFEYEDDRLRDHALELVGELSGKLGPGDEGNEEEWEDEGSGSEDEDEEMAET